MTCEKSLASTSVPIVDTAPGVSAPMALPLDFRPPELTPAPVPTLSEFQPDPWAFLEYQDPIEDPAMLAFQVAQLTVGMAALLRRIADLEERTHHERSQ